MSSSEVQRSSDNQENRSSDTDKDTQRNFSGQRSLDTIIQSIGQQSISARESKKIEYGKATGLNIYQSASKLPTSSMKENKGIFLKGEKVQNFCGLMSQLASCSSHPHERPHNSNLSTPEVKKDDQMQASETEKKAAPSSSIADTSSSSAETSSNIAEPSSSIAEPCSSIAEPNSSIAEASSSIAKLLSSIDKLSSSITRLCLSISAPAPFKGFALSPSNLPVTKGKRAESLSLEEACGYLPNLIKTKRCVLKGMEKQLDQVFVDLQKALQDAKNISILLEKAPKDVPQDLNAARVQAQKLTYLLSTSYRIFERLYKCGLDLKENIQEYSKQTGDYHSSVDVLLEYIMENILEKTRLPQGNF